MVKIACEEGLMKEDENSEVCSERTTEQGEQNVTGNLYIENP